MERVVTEVSQTDKALHLKNCVQDENQRHYILASFNRSKVGHMVARRLSWMKRATAARDLTDNCSGVPLVASGH